MTPNQEIVVRELFVIKNNCLAHKRTGKKVKRVRLGIVDVCGKHIPTHEIFQVLMQKRVDRRISESFDMARALPEMTLSRKAAHALGISIYRTGRACRYGHQSWRYVSNGACVACCGKLLP